MKLFRSSNKSQASLDRLTGSRDHSPTQQADPTHPYAQAYGGPPPATYPPHQYQQQQQQHQQQLQPPQQQHQPPEAYYTEARGQQHPAHVLSRSQSNRGAAGVGDPYAQEQQPTVNIVPPANIPAQQPQYAPAQTQFGQSHTVRTDKEHKKSGRFFKAFSSKRDDRDEAGDRRSVGRSSSILKRGGAQSPQSQQVSPKSPSLQYSDPRQAGLSERFSNENSPEDSEHYRQYRPSEEQYRPQEHFESPQSQRTRQSIQYVEDSRYQPQQPQQPQQLPQRHPSQDRQYQAYQLPTSANNSDNNLPYQPSRGSTTTYDNTSSLRPPSQTSLGPPSPLVGQAQTESRPSTSNTQQQRFSAQSQHQQVTQSQQTSTQQQSQQYQQQLQHPQPQYHHQQQQQQQQSLPPSQQATPQPTPLPTPQPQPVEQQLSAQNQVQAQAQSPSQSQPPQQSQQPQQQTSQPGHSQQPSVVSNMPRNEPTNGRRHEEQMYSQQDPRIRTQHEQHGTQGRSTPPPNRGREDLTSLDYNQLLSKHEELMAKYSKVKRYYFEREAQVTQLQNTVANQRLSMSKTSLDDAGYTNRFERLNGAIQNLAFNIRKDWRRVPNWLTPVCNRDAHSVGTKEMTAVGRACITRWLYESIFERVFHPGIDPNLSAHLKSIERALRRGQYGSMLSSDQQDDLLTKITTWRLTTVEGLQDVLSSRQSEVYTETLIMSLTKQLDIYLCAFLIDPPPPGLPDALGAVVAQTISIAQNIPLESRDICIEYFMPGSHIADTYMRVESGMTVLSQPGSAPTASDLVPSPNDNDDQQSTSSSQVDVTTNMNVEDAIRESAKAAAGPGQGPNSQRNESGTVAPGGGSKGAQQPSAAPSGKEKKGFLGGLVNKKAPPAAAQASMDQPNKPNDNIPDHAWNLQALTNGITDNKIRFAAFLAVEVRGRNVLKEAGKDASDKNNSAKDADEKKDGVAGSAGVGNNVGSAATGVQKSSATGANILCKAPVYAFE